MTARRLAGRCVEAIRGMAAVRSTGVSRLRLQARAAIVARHAARRCERRRLRVSLSKHRAAIAASWRTSATPRIRIDAVADQPAQVASVGVWELCTEPAAPPRPERLSLGDQVARAIARHPDGMAARDLGNELGVDWRRVVGVIAELVDAGLVERIGSRFYPAAGKASGQ